MATQIATAPVATLDVALYTAQVIQRYLIAAFALGVALLPLQADAPAAQDPAAALGLSKPNPVRPAKEFRVAKLDDGQLSLSEYKGKVVLLNFWATWCKPCEEEMPSMERLHQQYKDKGLVVLAISEDAGGAAVVAPYLKKHKLTFPVGLDPKSSVAGLYGVWAVPSTFIIDKRGNRSLFANGSREWDGPDAQALFRSLLR
jgi:peroxiredoxin